MAKQDEEKLRRIREYFMLAEEAEAEQRAERLDDLKFVRLGGEHQWPDYARKARNQPGQERPMLTINRLKQFRTSVINQIKLNTPSIKCHPVDDQGDKAVAEILQGVIRNIQRSSNGDSAVDKACEFAVDTGLGYFALQPRYVSDDAWEQELAFRLLPDPFKVYFDPHSVQVDGSDARWAIIAEDVPRSQFERDYPDVDVKGWLEAGIGDTNRWADKDNVRLAEFFELVEKPAELALLADGRTQWVDVLSPEEMPLVERVRASKRVSCAWTKVGGYSILESTEFPIPWVPIIPIYGEEFWVDGRRNVQGLVRSGKDSQRLYNFWQSSKAEHIALQTKAPWIGAEGSFEGHEKSWAAANNSNVPFLEYRPVEIHGAILPPPTRQPFPGIPTGIAEAERQAAEDMKASLGMYDPAVGGADSASQSGRAIRSLQAQSAQGTSHFADNTAKSMAHAGRILVSWIPSIYDTARVMRIVGDDGDSDHVRHDPGLPVPMQKTIDPRTGQVTKIYNLSLGRYDVYCSSGPSYQSRREEAADFWQEMVRAMPALLQVAGDIIFRNVDAPGSEQVADRMKAMLPPQIQQAEGQDEAVTPQMLAAQQQLQQAQQMIQQLDQAIQGMSKDLESKQAEDQAKLAELEIKRFDAETKRLQALAQIEASRAQPAPTDTGPSEIETGKLGLEHERMEREFDLKILEHLSRIEEMERAEAQREADESAKKAEAEKAEAGESESVRQVQELKAALADMAAKMESKRVVGIKPKRDPKTNRLIGGIRQFADGSEEPVSLQ